MSFAVSFPEALRQDLEIGASVAIDGCCQTVRTIDNDRVWFDAMQETLAKTTLGGLQPGQGVNVERSARFGQEIGGHELSGHVDAMLEIVHIEETADNHVLSLEVPQAFRQFVFNKGYLSVHGASLTVSDYEPGTGRFNVYLIPETLRVTNLGQLSIGDTVNMEVERKTQTIVETVNAYMARHFPQSG